MNLFNEKIDAFLRQGSNLNHVLVHADSLQKRTISKSSVDLTVTSPPYNVGKAYDGSQESDSIEYGEYLGFTEKWLANCYHWTKSTGRLCVNVSLDKNRNGKQPLSADVTKIAMDVGWKYHATIVWNEGNISRRTAWGSWMSASAPHVIAPVETIIVLYKDEWKRLRPGNSDIRRDEFKEWVFGVWCFNGENGTRIGHEAPFPRELPKRCIKLFSFEGDVVLDPFVGSGTTMVEAINNNRFAVGIEKEKEYCKLTLNRVKKECNLELKQSSQIKLAKSTKKSWKIQPQVISVV